MRTFDVRDVVKAPDELLARTDNPRHRAILTNFRRHALLEVAGRWPEILTPQMMVDTPVALSVRPSSGPEFTYVPSPGVAIPDSAGSG